MTTIRIHNADATEVADIQTVVNAHGFGILVVDGNDLVAVSPDTLNGMGMGAVEKDLLNDVGRHIGVTFTQQRHG